MPLKDIDFTIFDFETTGLYPYSCDKITRRTIMPKEIQKGYDKSYVVAHCYLKGGKRNFRLEGILEAKPEK